MYRNLAVLEHAGLVSKISMGDEHAHYELGEEITNNHHHHLVCTQCGTVSDVTLSPGAERSLDKALHEAAAGASFELHQHRVDLLGRCARCVAGLTRPESTAESTGPPGRQAVRMLVG